MILAVVVATLAVPQSDARRTAMDVVVADRSVRAGFESM